MVVLLGRTVFTKDVSTNSESVMGDIAVSSPL